MPIGNLLIHICELGVKKLSGTSLLENITKSVKEEIILCEFSNNYGLVMRFLVICTYQIYRQHILLVQPEIIRIIDTFRIQEMVCKH